MSDFPSSGVWDTSTLTGRGSPATHWALGLEKALAQWLTAVIPYDLSVPQPWLQSKCHSWHAKDTGQAACRPINVTRLGNSVHELVLKALEEIRQGLKERRVMSQGMRGWDPNQRCWLLCAAGTLPCFWVAPAPAPRPSPALPCRKSGGLELRSVP